MGIRFRWVSDTRIEEMDKDARHERGAASPLSMGNNLSNPIEIVSEVTSKPKTNDSIDSLPSTASYILDAERRLAYNNRVNEADVTNLQSRGKQTRYINRRLLNE